MSANVTVEVRHLSPETLSHSVPITLSPTTPTAIATNWTPNVSTAQKGKKFVFYGSHHTVFILLYTLSSLSILLSYFWQGGGGGLGTLTEAVKKVVGRKGDRVEVVSVYGIPSPSSSSHTHSKIPDSVPDTHLDPSSSTSIFPPPPPGELSTPHTCIWVSVKQSDGKFLDPIKLHGLLSLNIHRVSVILLCVQHYVGVSIVFLFQSLPVLIHNYNIQYLLLETIFDPLSINVFVPFQFDEGNYLHL